MSTTIVVYSSKIWQLLIFCLFKTIPYYILTFFDKSEDRRSQLAERNESKDAFSKVYFPRTHLLSIFRLVHAPTEFGAPESKRVNLQCCSSFHGPYITDAPLPVVLEADDVIMVVCPFLFLHTYCIELVYVRVRIII